MDHIKVYTFGNEKIDAIMNNNADFIKDEVLTDEILANTYFAESKEWNQRRKSKNRR